MEKIRIKLYVTGQTLRSERAVANLRRICEQALKEEHEIRIIDVLEDPRQAEMDKVLATPMLIKESPPPVRRIIGDLTDEEKVTQALIFNYQSTKDASQSSE